MLTHYDYESRSSFPHPPRLRQLPGSFSGCELTGKWPCSDGKVQPETLLQSLLTCDPGLTKCCLANFPHSGLLQRVAISAFS